MSSLFKTLLLNSLALFYLVIQTHFSLRVAELLLTLFYFSLIFLAVSLNQPKSLFSPLQNFIILVHHLCVGEFLLSSLNGFLFLLFVSQSELGHTFFLQLNKKIFTLSASSMVVSVPILPNLNRLSSNFFSSLIFSASSSLIF